MSQTRQEDIRVTREPRTYTVDGPYSWFMDVAKAGFDADARARLREHAREVVYEMDHNTPEGRAAEAAIREQTRVGNAVDHQRRVRETRQRALEERVRGVEHRVDATTAAASLGTFVTPAYVLEQWAPFRGVHRTFADQTTILPVPKYGMAVHIPALTTTASAGVQPSGENTSVAETVPSGNDLTTPMQVFTGQITISQQLYDRGFHDSEYNGGAFDVVAGEQVRQQLNETINRYVLQQALNGATQVAASATTFSLASFYGDVGDLRNKLTDTSGVRIRASHIFTTSDLYSFVTRQLDANSRPVLLPQFNPGPPAILDGTQHQKWWGFTGTVLPGILFWFVDDTIPAQGSNTQIIVSNPTKIVLFESDPLSFAYPQTLGNQLSVVVGMRSYVAAIPRYPGATAVVTGNAYPTSAS